MRLRPVFICLAAFCASASAQTGFSWHVFEVGVNLRPKLDLVLHERTRTMSGNALEQVRGGAVLRYAVHPKAVVYSGYYFQPQHTVDDRWIRGHRFFTGVETSRPLPKDMAWTGRVALERFFHAGRPDYNRYRSYLRLLIGRHKLVPYLQNEVLAVRDGFHSMRNSGGLRIRLAAAWTAEVGGLYDLRQTEWGGDRLALVTGIRWTPQAR